MNEILDRFSVLWSDAMIHPQHSIGIILNLILIESLLSVDNAAVLATMVSELPANQKSKALKYGIWGAYLFRGLAMIFVAFLIGIWWIKPLGGLYLLYLVYDQFNKDNDAEDPWLIKILVNPIKYLLTFLLSPFSKIFTPLKIWLDKRRQLLGLFWSTVILVEIMDMAFSIDNVFAAVAFTPNIILVCIGVFIGILSMRFIAQWFVKLMEKYPFLENAAFIVIAVLGIKLLISIFTHYYPCSEFTIFLDGDHECRRVSGLPIPTDHNISNGDKITSALTVAIFFIPILSSMLFNYPKKIVLDSDKK